jgi:hypothetical protein
VFVTNGPVVLPLPPRLWRLSLDASNTPVATLTHTICGEGDSSSNSPMASLGTVSPSPISSIVVVKDVAFVAAGGAIACYEATTAGPVETGVALPAAEFSPDAMENWLVELQSSTPAPLDEPQCPMSPAQRIMKNRSSAQASIAGEGLSSPPGAGKSAFMTFSM